MSCAEIGFPKANVDAPQFANSMKNRGKFGAEDDLGQFVTTRDMRISGMFRTSEAEILGLMEGLLWVKNLDLQNIEVEMDAQVVVNAILRKNTNNTSFSNLILDYLNLINTINGVLLSIFLVTLIVWHIFLLGPRGLSRVAIVGKASYLCG